MSEQMSLGQRIKEIRALRGYSQRKLAIASDLSNTTVSRLESGSIKNPVIETLKKIEEALRLPENDLVSIAYPSLLGENMHPDSCEGKLRRIPIYNDLQPNEPIFLQEEIIDYEYVSHQAFSGKDCFYLKVSGDWMNKSRLYEGDQILVMPQGSYENGDMVVVQDNEGNISVKKLMKSQTTVLFQPDSHNPLHQPKLFTTREFAQSGYKIIGKVVAAKIKL